MSHLQTEGISSGLSDLSPSCPICYIKGSKRLSRVSLLCEICGVHNNFQLLLPQRCHPRFASLSTNPRVVLPDVALFSTLPYITHRLLVWHVVLSCRRVLAPQRTVDRCHLQRQLPSLRRHMVTDLKGSSVIGVYPPWDTRVAVPRANSTATMDALH